MALADDKLYRVRSFRVMLVHISRKLSDSNLETLKYLCEPEGVPVSELEACTSGIRVFQLLEQRDKLSANNLVLLKFCLSALGRDDLSKLVQEYENDAYHDGPRPANCKVFQSNHAAHFTLSGPNDHLVDTGIPVSGTALGEGNESRPNDYPPSEPQSNNPTSFNQPQSGDSQQNDTASGSSERDDILEQRVNDRPGHLMLFRKHVSRTAAGKGRAVLEGVGLDSHTIEACFQDRPLNEEEAVQAGLIKWKDRESQDFPPTWKVLVAAMEYATVAQQHVQDLKAELGLE